MQPGNYNSQTLPHRLNSKDQKAKKAVVINSDERSISESLALISQHVSSLGEVGEPGVLAPPPGFSDPESYSDNESLSSNGSKGFKGSR